MVKYLLYILHNYTYILHVADENEIMHCDVLCSNINMIYFAQVLLTSQWLLAAILLPQPGEIVVIIAADHILGQPLLFIS